ncbi:hypothetical protein P4S73_13490 [Paraglaciecola sp. Hal342]
MNVSHILVIADRKESLQKAVGHGAILASQFNASVHVAGFCYERLSILADNTPKQELDNAKQKIIQTRQAKHG